MHSDPNYLRADVLVVGGGVAGLACAVALGDRGLTVVAAERDRQLGGRARSWADATTGDVIDIGPHVVHSEYRNFGALLARLGTRELIAWQPEKLITLASKPPLVLRHRRLPQPFSLVPDFQKAPGLDGRDFHSNTRTIWRALRFREAHVAALDTMSALDFLRGHRVTERMIDFFWRWESIVIPNAPLERCSAASLMRVQSQLMGYHRVHFGFPAVGLGDLFAPGAHEAIEASGGRVLLDARVARIERSGDGFEAAIEGHGTVRARHVVVAIPPQDLALLLPEMAPEGLEPTPYISTYLWLDRKVTRERFWSQLWSPTRLNYDFYDLSNIRPAWADRPSVIAANIIYSHRAAGLADDAIVEATLREVAEFAPEAATARVQHAAVNRIPMAVVCPTVGMERKRPRTRTAISRLHLAGDWTKTGQPSSMEGAALSGYLAAEAVLEDEGRPASVRPPPSRRSGLERWLRPATDEVPR